MQHSQRQTLATAFCHRGTGLHSGAAVQVRVGPAAPGAGRYFVRVDLPQQPRIPAHISAVAQTVLSTELARGEARVRTVEHLLASLVGLGVDDARIELDGPEVPLLDGSACDWVEAIAQVGVVPQGNGAVYRSVPLPLREPLWIQEETAFVAALPAPELRFTYGIDFQESAIGNQWQSWSSNQENFAQVIAPARTFGILSQLKALQAGNLIQGGSLENALVCGPHGWVNPPLRFANEPVRHKLLDLVGDLSLLGIIPQAHYLAYKASHRLHTQLAQKLAALPVPSA